MLGIAGLAFAACSNEEDAINNGNPTFEGNGAVSIRLVNPMTKTITTPDAENEDDEVFLADADLTINLYEEGNNDMDDPDQTITINTSKLTTDQTVTFWNVTDPGKVTASINGGVSDYSTVAINTVQQVPTAIPAYGETSTFTPKTSDPTTGSPDMDNDVSNGGHETGATTDDEDKVYTLYEATIEMKIPVARLEVSGIVHVDAQGSQCEYETLSIAGVYMDNLYLNGAAYTATGYGQPAGDTNIKDYSYDGIHGTGEEAILKDAATPTNFLTDGAVWPATGSAYAYNFYAGTEKPIFKIYFNESEESATSPEPHPAPRYAMIKEYTGVTNFEPGKIYRIKKAELADGNIIGDEGGNTQYGIIVTIEEAKWSVLDIDATWVSK